MPHYVRLVKGDHNLKPTTKNKLVKVTAHLHSEVILSMAKIMGKEKSTPDEILQSFLNKTFGVQK